MKYRLKLLLGTSVFLCVLLTQIAVADVAVDRYRAAVMADDPCLYITMDEYWYEDANRLRLYDYSGHDYWVGSSPRTMFDETPGAIGLAARFGGGQAASAWVSAANRRTEPPREDDEGEPYVSYKNEYAFTTYGETKPADDVPSGIESDVTFEFWYKTTNPVEWILDNYGVFFNQARPGYVYVAGLGEIVQAPQFGRANRFGADGGPNGEPNNSEGSRAYRVRDGNENSYSDLYIWPIDQWWHHIVIEYNDTGAIGNMLIKVYLDTDLIIDANRYGYGRVGREADDLLIGNSGNKNAPQVNGYCGYIDEFAVYKGLLSEERILAHYNAFQPQSCEEMRDREWGKTVGPYFTVSHKYEHGGGTIEMLRNKKDWWLEFDLNRDCKLDFYDFANFASSWRNCNDPCDPNNCTKNWE